MHIPSALLSVLLYLDPGSGSFILQLIIAGFLGGLFVFRSYLARFFTWLKKIVRRDKDSDRGDD